MLEIDKNQLISVFDAYVSTYDMENIRIKLKRDHTLRVAEICEQIAKSLDMTEFEIKYCWLMGLLHDIARFEQVKQFNTFNDRASFSHAEFGCDLLFKEKLIDKFFPNADDFDFTLLEKAVRCHSDYIVPENYNETERLFSNILRDADKIDIIKVITETPVEVTYGASWNVIVQQTFTPAVLEIFKQHRTIPRSIGKKNIDLLLGFSSFVFELVFPESKKILVKQGYIFKLLDFPSTNPENQKEVDFIRREIETFLECDNHS